MNLRVVDPITDPGIWAIVDDACNLCCMGEKWFKNAKEKWKKIGFDAPLIKYNPTKFSGVGEKMTGGKYKIPISL